jgi:3-oxoacyl-[acyl-carrier-protein] synthase-3
MIRSGQAKNVLLVTSELFSRIVDWTDRATCVLFGDGASAVVLTESDGKSGIIDSKIHADGRYADYLVAGAGSATGDDPKQRYVTMKGNHTFKVAVNTMSSVTRELLDNNDLAVEDIDLIVPHQANIRILNAVAKNLGLDEEKFFINVHKYGNTSATSIPLAMYEAVAEGRLKRGDKLLLVAFGGGFTWGASLINF